jgi:hypothetical protein
MKSLRQESKSGSSVRGPSPESVTDAMRPVRRREAELAAYRRAERESARASFLKEQVSGAVSAAALAAVLMWPASDAEAACAPPTGPGTPSNTTVTCGTTNNQDNPDGYGTGAQNNNTVNVQTGASVSGTNNGFFLGNDNTINLATGASVTGGQSGMDLGTGTSTVNNNNGGTISASGNALSATGVTAGGTLIINNTGTISSTTSAVNGSASAINAITANVTNIGGNITSNANGLLSAAIFVSNLTITNNTGNIAATGTNTSGSLGIFAVNTLLVSANSGTISGIDQGIGME